MHKRVCLQRHTRFVFYTPMQLDTPKVVAMAVSTVIRMFRIYLPYNLSIKSLRPMRLSS